jgi:hypothetical protein
MAAMKLLPMVFEQVDEKVAEPFAERLGERESAPERRSATGRRRSTTESPSTACDTRCTSNQPCRAQRSLLPASSASMTPCRRATIIRVARAISQSKAKATTVATARSRHPSAGHPDDVARRPPAGLRLILARALGCLLQGELLLRVQVIFDDSRRAACRQRSG